MNKAAINPQSEREGGGESTHILHASCVALDRHAALILGPSGAGKSALALQLMALGADLVADDKTHVQAYEYAVVATAMDPIKGMIEARGVGVLAAQICRSAQVHLVIDLAQEERERLPPQRTYILLGHSVPLVHKVKADYFPAAILQYLKGGRCA